MSDIVYIHGKGLTSMGCNTYMGMPSILASDHQSYGPSFYTICKPPSHPRGSVSYDMRYRWLYMGCHPLQMSCGCMAQDSQAWDVIHTWGCPQSRPQTTKNVRQDSTGSANYQAFPPGGCYDKVPMVIDGFPPLADVLWMHGEYLTSLGCNTYMGMPSI